QVRLKGHSAAVTSLAFLPKGQELVTASEDGTLTIWSLVRALGGPTIRRHKYPVQALAFIPKDEQQSKRAVPNAPESKLELIPDEEKPMLAAVGGQSGKGGEIRLWGSHTGADLGPLETEEPMLAVRAVAAEVSGNLLATGGEEMLVNLIDLNRMKSR